MSAYANLHFCLIGAEAPRVVSSAHDRMPDVIDVTVRLYDASFSVSGATADVRAVLTEMLNAAMRVVPLAPQATP